MQPGEIQYVTGSEEMLDEIEELWLELNRYHSSVSTHFSRRFKNFSFQRRKEVLLEKAHGEAIRVDLAIDKTTDETIGYCLSTIVERNVEKTGEVESLYVKSEYRNRNIGMELMKRALAWLDSNIVHVKKLVVAVGNDKVYNFYERLGFYPKTIQFEQIPELKSEGEE